MALTTQRLLHFGPFVLDAERRLLSRDSERVSLRPRVFDTLLVLIANAGRVVAKEDLLEAVWPDTVVEENNLNQNILVLRRVFENGGQSQIRIETVPRRGYRLIASVSEEEEEEPVRVEIPVVVTAPETPAPQTALALAPAPAAAALRSWSRRRITVAAGIAVAALLTGWIWRVAHAPSPILGVRSIAVLPLRTLGATASDEYLGLGLADALITRLGFVRSLSVRPTSSLRRLGEASADPVAAGRQLRVDAVLDGQIQKSDGRIRVTVQLVGVRNGATLWSEKFDVKASDLFSIEDAVSEAVARELTMSLPAGEAHRLSRDRPTTPEAYDAYLKGRYFWNQRTQPSAQKSRELFERAIALDPEYAPAYAGLADALNSLPRSEQTGRAAREMAEKALALDDSLAEAYASLGNASLFTDWNFSEAEARFRRAIDLNPSYATAHQWYAYCFLVRGDLPGATREIRRAREIDPLSCSIGVDAGLMDYYAQRYDDAIAQYRRVLELAPGFLQARQSLTLALLLKGETAAAREACPSGNDPGGDFRTACTALIAAFSGDRARAQGAASSLDTPTSWTTRALVAATLGDRDAAMAAVEDGYRVRAADVLLLGADPAFDGLRGEPRFAALTAKVGIQPVSR